MSKIVNGGFRTNLGERLKSSKGAVFATLDGTAWTKSLPEARKRRSGQGKRIAEAIANHSPHSLTDALDERYTKFPEMVDDAEWRLYKHACELEQELRRLTTVTTAGAVTKVNPTKTL